MPSISLQGGSGDIIAGGQINAGDAYDNGVVLNKDFPQIQVFSGGSGNDDGVETIKLNGDNGSINLNGLNGENFSIDYNGFYDIRANSLALKQQSNPANNSFEVYNNGDASYMNLNNSNNENSISLNGDAGSINTLGGIRSFDNMSVWYNNGGGDAEYALTNVRTGGQGGAVYGNIFLNDDLGHSLDLSGEGPIGASGDISAGGNINAEKSMNIGGNTFDGELTLSSNSNTTTGIRMYGNLGGQGVPRSHIQLDGNNGEHVALWGDGGIDVTHFMNVGFNSEISMDGASGHISASTIDATNTSDKRFKKNIQPLESVLKKSLQLNGKSYQWNELANKEKSLKINQNKIGVIAQEVEKQFPALVQTDAKGYKSVDYAGLTAVLLEAIKELSAKVTTLESENSDLKASLDRLSDLESKINLIEKLLINKPVDTSKSTALK